MDSPSSLELHLTQAPSIRAIGDHIVGELQAEPLEVPMTPHDAILPTDAEHRASFTLLPAAALMFDFVGAPSHPKSVASNTAGQRRCANTP